MNVISNSINSKTSTTITISVNINIILPDMRLSFIEKNARFEVF